MNVVLRRLMILVGVMLCGALAALADNADAGTAKTFFADLASKAAQAEKNGKFVLRGKENWLFFSTELTSLGVGGPFWGEQAEAVSHVPTAGSKDPLAAILDFKQQLDKAGIELILVPVPAKATIYPEMISDTATAGADKSIPRFDIYHQQFYDVLKTQGVKVIDLSSIFLQHRFDKDGMMYCRQDTHWSGQACTLAAKAIADELRDRAWLKTVPKHKYEAQTQTVDITGDLWTMLGDATLPKEQLKLSVVNERTATGLSPIDSWRESPIVLLGDSHTLVFHGGGDMLYVGAGLADHLAMQLGIPVDLVGVRGSGATPARRNLARRRDNMAGKKAVIWCFTVREFTEGQGWAKVQVIRDEAAK